LPAAGVTVLEDGESGDDDEGRAMAELIHATAPAAQLYFYSGFYSEIDMASGIAALRAAGCQIIVDDVTYADEPFFQDAGPIDTAVQAAVAAGVDYFTAVGNDASSFYQAVCAPTSANIAGIGAVEAQVFSNGATTQTVTIPAGYSVTLSLQWNAPYNASNADPITVKVLAGRSVIATSTQVGSEPVVIVTFPDVQQSRSYSIAIVYNGGVAVPGLFKYVLEGGGSIDDPAAGVGSGAAVGQALLPGVNVVGAVNVAATPAEGGTPTPEAFSSSGGGTFLFAANGAALATPQTANGPDFLAPDGAGTSVFNPFDGTSAAAPVAAAVAALMLQADSALGTADISVLLADSAIPAGAARVAGAGLIQANLATEFASTRVISGSPQPVVHGLAAACTIVGGAGAHWLIAGSGAALIESSGTDSVAAGAGADTVDLTGAAAALYGSTGSLWVRTMGGNDTVVGGSGVLDVSGGAGGGVIFGSTGGRNQLFAGVQPTTIVARGSGDFLAGNGNGDQLYASNLGNETLAGGGGTEVLIGGTAGTDIFDAGAGDPLIGPEGSTAVVTFGIGDSTVQAGSGAELFQAVDERGGGFDVIYGFDPAKDMLLLTGYGAEPAVANTVVADQYDIGGASWLKLSDNTIIAFVGLAHLNAGNVS